MLMEEYCLSAFLKRRFDRSKSSVRAIRFRDNLVEVCCVKSYLIFLCCLFVLCEILFCCKVLF